MSEAIADRLRNCFQDQRFAELGALYADDATLEIRVGDAYIERRGRDAIVERYAEDFAGMATFLRWDARETGWGAVVEADAVQGEGDRRFRYQWVHLLTVAEGRITHDSVYCTGAVRTQEATPTSTSVGLLTSLAHERLPATAAIGGEEHSVVSARVPTVPTCLERLGDPRHVAEGRPGPQPVGTDVQAAARAQSHQRLRILPVHVGQRWSVELCPRAPGAHVVFDQPTLSSGGQQPRVVVGMHGEVGQSNVVDEPPAAAVLTDEQLASHGVVPVDALAGHLDGVKVGIALQRECLPRLSGIGRLDQPRWTGRSSLGSGCPLARKWPGPTTVNAIVSCHRSATRVTPSSSSTRNTP